MGKRFGVLLCAPDESYLKKKYGGYFTLFASLLSEPGETWDLFRVVDHQFPATEDLCNYHGFVVTGSRYDAHGNDLWILKLCNLLQTLYAMDIKVLGICFGHQVLCRALGGKIGRSLAGWDIGVRKIRVSDKLSAKYPGFKIPSVISIIECHQDKVYRAPLGAEIVGSSVKTNIEMFCVGDNIMGIQGHPEYTTDILFHLVDGILDKNLAEVRVFLNFQEKINEDALQKKQPDRDIWQKICKSFLKA